MAASETRGALQSNSPTSKSLGATPGGPFRLDMTRPIATPVSPHRCAMQLLIALIEKKPGQPKPLLRNE